VDLKGSPFLRACRGERPDRTPVWILRQAGRYLPQYRAVRSRFPDFLAFLRTPEAAAEVTCQPIEALGVDAAILFSDILTVLPPLGFDLAFREGEGPRISNPLRAGEGRELPHFDPTEEIPWVQDAVRACRKALPSDIPLIGFAGAPWTLACYAIDGGGNREFSKTRAWLHSDPASFSRVLDSLADVVTTHLEAQARAGCQALQLFESWGGLLSPSDYRRVVVPVLERIGHALRLKLPDVPVILYCNGASTLLPVLSSLPFDVFAVDWRIGLAQARAELGKHPLQGNFDPTLLHAPEETIRQRVRDAARDTRGGAWIANLGHGIMPDAPVSGAKALVDAIHALKPGEPA
jgi:uroporphyrinogen decarboxylase